MTFGKGILLKTGQRADDGDGADRFNGFTKNLLMPLAVDLIQYNTLNRSMRREFLATQNQRGSRTCHFGSVKHEHDGRAKDFSEVCARIGACGVEPIEESAVALDHIDAVGSSVAQKGGANCFGAHQECVEITSRMSRCPCQPRRVDIVRPLLESANLEPRAPEQQQKAESDNGLAGATGEPCNEQARHERFGVHNRMRPQQAYSVPSLGGSWMYEPPR